MKRSWKIVYTLFIFVCMVFLLQNVSLADGDDVSAEGSSSTGWNPKSQLTDANSWGSDNDGGIANTAQTIVGTILNVMRIVGTGISLIMITYVAIKYMSAAPNEKAEFKKSATGLIVGAIVLFGSSNILSVIAGFATENIK